MEASFKVVKIVGESDESIEVAVKGALKTSADHVHGQTWLQVTDIRAHTNGRGRHRPVAGDGRDRVPGGRGLTGRVLW